MNLPTSLTLILLGLAFVVAEMLVTFRVARRLRNFGIVDIVWSVGFTPLVLLYLLATAWPEHSTTAKGSDLREALISRLPLTLMVTLWSLRLGLHLLIRVRAHHPVEDVRYAQLRKEWGAQTDQKCSVSFCFKVACKWSSRRLGSLAAFDRPQR